MNENQIPSILTEDLTETSLAMPLLPVGIYDLMCKKVELTTTKKGADMLKITLETVLPCTAVDGRPINAHFPIFDQIVLTETENYDKDAIKRRMKTFRLSVLGEADGPFFPLDQYEGKVFKANITVTKEQVDKSTGETFPAKNGVKYDARLNKVQ